MALKSVLEDRRDRAIVNQACLGHNLATYYTLSKLGRESQAADLQVAPRLPLLVLLDTDDVEAGESEIPYRWYAARWVQRDADEPDELLWISIDTHDQPIVLTNEEFSISPTH